MSPQVEQVLERLHARLDEERRVQETLSGQEFSARLHEFMLPIGEQAGRFLNLLAKASGARALLELGTSVGYSTVWLAEAARTTGGHVVTVDADPAKHAQARANLAQAGLAGYVTFVTGDALEAIAAQPGPFDLVLLDTWKDAYVPCLRAFAPKLAPGALVAADNMIQPPSENTRRYREHVQAAPGYETVLVPIGNGIELTRKQA